MASKSLVGTSFEDLYRVFYSDINTFESKKVRLFPSGNTDNEQATVSIFLASLSAVKEYREELFQKIGINKIKTRNVNLHAYVEIQGGNDNDRPDGLLVITSGKLKPVIEWIGFVEAKIGDNKLETTQLEKYGMLAKQLGIENIITISNELVTDPSTSPVKIKENGRNFYHWSWAYLKVTSQRLINIGLEDEDHVYILSELRRYFDKHKRMKHFIDMGQNWKECASLIGDSHDLNKKIDKLTISKIIPSLIQEEKDISLQLTDKTDFLVELVAKENRESEIEQMLQDERKLISTYKIDDDKYFNFKIGIDFIRQEIRCSTQVVISNGKAQAQTSSLIKMLENNAGYQDNIFVNAIYPRNKSVAVDTVTLSKLSEERENKCTQYSVLDKNLGDKVKYFEVRTRKRIGKKFLGTKTFISEVEEFSKLFFNQVMRNIV